MNRKKKKKNVFPSLVAWWDAKHLTSRVSGLCSDPSFPVSTSATLGRLSCFNFIFKKKKNLLLPFFSMQQCLMEMAEISTYLLLKILILSRTKYFLLSQACCLQTNNGFCTSTGHLGSVADEKAPLDRDLQIPRNIIPFSISPRTTKKWGWGQSVWASSKP